MPTGSPTTARGDHGNGGGKAALPNGSRGQSSASADGSVTPSAPERKRRRPHGWTEEQWLAKTGGGLVPLRLHSWRDVPAFVVMLPVRAYQLFLGPLLPEMCRYEPSCSSFMLQAIQQKGAFWGVIIGTIRIVRCNPFFPGGYDPVEAWWPWPQGRRRRRHRHAGTGDGCAHDGDGDGDGDGALGEDDERRGKVEPAEGSRTA